MNVSRTLMVVEHDDAGRVLQGSVEVVKIVGASVAAALVFGSPNPASEPAAVRATASTVSVSAPSHDMPERDPIVFLETGSIVVTGSGGASAYPETAHASAQAFDATVRVGP